MKFVHIVLLLSSHAWGSFPLQGLKECTGVGGTWDFNTEQCNPGRKWLKVPNDLRNELDRPLTAKELEAGKQAIGFYHVKANSDAAPQAIILVGAGGSGKSHICTKLDSYLPGIKLSNFVQLDGDILREYHGGFIAATKEPNQGYTDAWPIIKPHIFTSKAQIMKELVSKKLNVVIPTGIHTKALISEMLGYGYQVSLVGLYVDFDTAYYRGLNRAQTTGRTYAGTLENWITGISDMNRLARENKVSKAVLINNTDFKNPMISYQRFNAL